MRLPGTILAGRKMLLEEGVRAGRPVIEPFIHLAVSDRPEDLKASAGFMPASVFRPRFVCAGMGRAGRRNGFASAMSAAEFRAQATLYLMAGLFEAHDQERRSRFSHSTMTGAIAVFCARRFEAAVENIIDIRQMSDAEAAARIHAA